MEDEQKTIRSSTGSSNPGRRHRMMDDHGQMMVLEVTFFAATVILSLIFIYQLSPPSIVVNKFTDELKIQGDDALSSLYNDVLTEQPLGYPSNKLVYYLVTNDYGDLISDLNNWIPSDVMYNIYIYNGTKKMFWCSSTGDTNTPLKPIQPITICHYIIPIHPNHLHNLPPKVYLNGASSDLYSAFYNYDGSTYEIILEMWYI